MHTPTKPNLSIVPLPMGLWGQITFRLPQLSNTDSIEENPHFPIRGCTTRDVITSESESVVDLSDPFSSMVNTVKSYLLSLAGVIS